MSLCNNLITPNPMETKSDRLQKLQDANCDEPAIAVWMGMRCQSAVISQPCIQPMIHPVRRGG